jgi:hypothetical protein
MDSATGALLSTSPATRPFSGRGGPGAGADSGAAPTRMEAGVRLLGAWEHEGNGARPDRAAVSGAGSAGYVALIGLGGEAGHLATAEVHPDLMHICNGRLEASMDNTVGRVGERGQACRGRWVRL